jgi:hypothetical protein
MSAIHNAPLSVADWSAVARSVRLIVICCACAVDVGSPQIAMPKITTIAAAKDLCMTLSPPAISAALES